MTELKYIAWTGGSAPNPITEIGVDELASVCYLFRMQIAHWVYFWGDFPSINARSILWNRARYDAHATHRE